MTFTAGNPDTKWNYLIEIEIGHRIDGDVWAQAAGPNTNCWYMTHGEGKPSKVEEYQISTAVAILYTEQGSLANCHANAKSWYWDSVNSYLYVNTTDSDDPSGGDYILESFFWEYYTSGAVEIFNGHEYLPYVDASSIPDITVETSGYYAGGTQQSFGSIKLINADSYFDARLTNYIYAAKKIIVLVGEDGDAYTDYTTIWTGWTSNITWTDVDIEVGVEDLRKCMATPS
jgi:hypothetical protein